MKSKNTSTAQENCNFKICLGNRVRSRQPGKFSESLSKKKKKKTREILVVENLLSMYIPHHHMVLRHEIDYQEQELTLL